MDWMGTEQATGLVPNLKLTQDALLSGMFYAPPFGETGRKLKEELIHPFFIFSV